ncbi:MAG: hypothetical protein V4672_02700 [Verrucomicrobiota bacterium]
MIEGRSFAAADLTDGFQLVPLDDDDLDAIGFPFTEAADGFTHFSPNLSRFLCEQSSHGPLVYLETEYFGGMGTQAAVAFIDGSPMDSTLLTGDDAINRALKAIGVIAASGVDEFDHLGLSRHRYTSVWKEVAHNFPA